MEVVTLLLRMRLLRRVRCVFDNFAGANPDAPTESEYIPLWVSARDGMTEVVESLVGTPPSCCSAIGPFVEYSRRRLGDASRAEGGRSGRKWGTGHRVRKGEGCLGC